MNTIFSKNALRPYGEILELGSRNAIIIIGIIPMACVLIGRSAVITLTLNTGATCDRRLSRNTVVLQDHKSFTGAHKHTRAPVHDRENLTCKPRRGRFLLFYRVTLRRPSGVRVAALTLRVIRAGRYERAGVVSLFCFGFLAPPTTATTTTPDVRPRAEVFGRKNERKNLQPRGRRTLRRTYFALVITVENG